MMALSQWAYPRCTLTLLVDSRSSASCGADYMARENILCFVHDSPPTPGLTMLKHGKREEERCIGFERGGETLGVFR